MRPTEVLTATNPTPTSVQPSRAGEGTIHVGSFAGRTYLARLRCQSPLKLLTPRPLPNAARVIIGSYGGGLVAGDHIRLHVEVESRAALYLGTQASTKVYRSIDGLGCGQELRLRVDADATCVILPDPVTPYEHSIYEQRQTIHLANGASLVLLDWLTAGRGAYGERWQFARYSSRTDIFVDGRQMFRDSLLLDSSDGALEHRARTGGFDCLATVLLTGPSVEASAAALLESISRATIGRNELLVFSASPMYGGTVVRVAGAGSDLVRSWLRDRLGFVTDLLGEDPWARKW